MIKFKQESWFILEDFTRLFKEPSDSANFNQVIVKQPCIPPCKAKYKHKHMTQHKPDVALHPPH